MAKPEFKNILIRVRVPLLKRLDAAARAQHRSRNSEVNLRLAESLRPKKQERPS